MIREGEDSQSGVMECKANKFVLYGYSSHKRIVPPEGAMRINPHGGQHEEIDEKYMYHQRCPAGTDRSVSGRRRYFIRHDAGISILGGRAWQMSVYPGASVMGYRSGHLETLAVFSGTYGGKVAGQAVCRRGDSFLSGLVLFWYTAQYFSGR